MFSSLSKTNFSFSVTFILSSASAFNLDQTKTLSLGKEFTAFSPFSPVFSKAFFFRVFQGDPSDHGKKFYKVTKRSSLYSQSLLIFIDKTPVVGNHPTKREIRELQQSRSTPTGITIYFYMSSSFIYKLEIHRREF